MDKKSTPRGHPIDRLIHEARHSMQNPYAYLGSEGQFEAEPVRKGSSRHPLTGLEGFGRFRQFAASYRGSGNHQVGRSYSEGAISAIVTKLQRDYWTERSRCWPGGKVEDPVEFLDPCRFLQAFSYKVSKEPLGRMRTENGSFDVAGTIDNYTRQVLLSDTLETPVARFTAAHELGHAVLHDQSGLHRDRPLDGSNQEGHRSAIEVEADRFAVHFLMPEKLVREEFFLRFGLEQLKPTEGQVFMLDPSGKLELSSDRRALARSVASKRLTSKVGILLSLAERFGVSNEAMAIRLEELGLVCCWQETK